tara:strand:+ start:396 stop:731 length:336 start_codon:yes stop_codon:yes gene_type:complete
MITILFFAGALDSQVVEFFWLLGISFAIAFVVIMYILALVSKRFFDLLLQESTSWAKCRWIMFTVTILLCMSIKVMFMIQTTYILDQVYSKDNHHILKNDVIKRSEGFGKF